MYYQYIVLGNQTFYQTRRKNKKGFPLTLERFSFAFLSLVNEIHTPEFNQNVFPLVKIEIMLTGKCVFVLILLKALT